MVRLAAVLAAVLAVAMSASANALPKQSNSARCVCICFVSSGDGPVVSYDSKGIGCGSFNGKACNVNDPHTGGVQTGKLDGCSPDTTSTTHVLPDTILKAKDLQTKMSN